MRFPEFSDEWEKQCLGNLGTTIIGLTYKPSELTNDGSGIIVFRSSNIQKGMIDYSDLVRVSKKIKSNLFTQEDDILICARNGSEKLIGKNAIIEKSDANKTFGAFMMIYRSQQNRFVKQLLETRRYATQISENLGARINQVTTSDFNGFEFFFPKTDEEKKKIAIFLRLIDKRIALQNKIIEDLKKLKSAIIEKSFTQGGDAVLISDLITQVSKRNNTDYNLPVLSVNNRLGFIRQSEQFEDRTVASDDTSNYKVVSADDFAFNPARINVGSVARLKSETNGIVSPMYICFHTNDRVLPEYFEYFFETKYFYSEMQKRLEGSVRLCLSWEGLCNISISLPNIEQQIEIGKKISTIATKIDLEERYLQNLKLQKQYLLQQMFI